MKLITRQDLANGAADLLRQFAMHEEAHRVESLGANPKPEQVDGISGSLKLATLTCSSCRRECARVVEAPIGDQNAEYLVDRGGSVYLCADCVLKMAELFAVTK